MSITQTDQFRQGKSVEETLDRYFSRSGWSVRILSPREERQQCLGDRELTRGSERWFVEYKSGIQSHYTGNCFLETISVDTTGRLGWVFTSHADFIIYACLLDHKLLTFSPGHLRARIEDLKTRFPTVATSRGQNEGYRTWGVIVPMAVAESELALRITPIEEESLL